jgi:hypothetical protein
VKILKYIVLLFFSIFLSNIVYAEDCGTCNWYGTNYPVCCNQTIGWGWEDDYNCIGATECTNTGHSLESSSNSKRTCKGVSYCENITEDDPDGDGWGWNGTKSCIVQGSSEDTCINESSEDSSSKISSKGNCPSSLNCPSGINCGCYTVSGLGAIKQAYIRAGADRRFLASAMLETETMSTDYLFGDSKTEDEFNAGACKQNWYMARHCHPDWNNLDSDDYSVMIQMNEDKSLDVQVYNECRSYYGDIWFAGHRYGEIGLKNPNTENIKKYKSAYDWIYKILSGHESNDIRFWIELPPKLM